jgi:transcriptional regulator with XRE-family HTH domain
MDKEKKDPVKDLLATNLKKYRHALGLSQERFAEKLGMGHSMLAAIETQDKFPSSKSLYKISQALNVEVFELFVPENEEQTKDLSDVGDLREQLKEDLSELIDTSFHDFIIK